MKFNWTHITLCTATVAVIALWVTSFLSLENNTVEKIHYKIESVEGVRNLISISEIQQQLDAIYDLDAGKIKISNLNLAGLESAISKDNRVLDTEAHLDALRHLHINVIQRRPVVRIMDKSGAQYYLDQVGEYVSKQEYKAIRVPIATGEIEAFHSDWKEKKSSKIYQCFTIIEALQKDKFYTSLVEQIHFEEQRIIMIPKIGSEKIIISNLEDIDNKLRRLKTFYKTEMSKGNAWGKYEELDITWDNQVVPRTTKP